MLCLLLLLLTSSLQALRFFATFGGSVHSAALVIERSWTIVKYNHLTKSEGFEGAGVDSIFDGSWVRMAGVRNVSSAGVQSCFEKLSVVE